jgi:hypothetical protein
MAVPAWEMASSAYSTWYRRPSGEKMVVYKYKRGKLRSLPLPAATMMAVLGLWWSCTTGLTYSGIVSSRHGGRFEEWGSR